MTRILADALRERGYLKASITSRPVLEHAPERFPIQPDMARDQDTNAHDVTSRCALHAQLK